MRGPRGAGHLAVAEEVLQRATARAPPRAHAVAAVPSDGSFTAVVETVIVSDADLDVLDRVIASFSVTS